MNFQRYKFLEGLLRPSKTALLGSLCVVIGWVLFCMRFVTPQLLAAAPGRFAAHNKDEYPFVSARAWNLTTSTAMQRQVVIIGDSAVREAIASEQILADEISTAVGYPVDVTLLAAGGMTHFEATAITDLIHDHVNGLIAVEISPYNLATPPIVLRDVVPGRLAFQSERLRDEYPYAGMKSPFLTHNYFLDNFKFWIARPGAALGMFSPPIVMRQHLQKGATPWNDKKWAENHKHVYGWEASYRAYRRQNLEVYGRMVTQVQSSGKTRFVLLETVLNPHNTTAWGMSRGDRIVRQEYETDVQTFAIQNRIPWVNAGTDANLAPEDFLDYTHVRTAAGRAAYTHALAIRLAAILAENAKPPVGS